MGHVIVGIIGIGLLVTMVVVSVALAGPQLKRAFSTTRALSISQMIAQISQASTIHRVEVQRPVIAREPVYNLVGNGYLSELPINPFLGKGGLPFRMLYSGDLESRMYYADIVYVSLGYSEDAAEVCRAIERQYRGSKDVGELPLGAGPSVASMTTGRMGCFKMHDVGIYGEAYPHSYVVYARL